MTERNDLYVCGACCGITTLIAGAICFLVFGIIFLVNDWDIYKACSGSNMGPYVIVALILTGGNGRVAKKDDKEIAEMIATYIFYFLLNVGLASWGGVELWQKSCTDLKDTNLWKFSLAIFILQTVSAVIIILIPIIGCIVLKDSSESTSDEQNTPYTIPRSFDQGRTPSITIPSPAGDPSKV